MKDYLTFMKNVINLNLNHLVLQIIIAVTSKWMLIQTIIIYNDVFTRCNYYTETQLVRNSKQIEGLSCIHFNDARSLNANFAKIRNLTDELKSPFDTIAITET